VLEEANYPDYSSPAAVDGTGTHLLVELCLNGSVSANTYLNSVIGVGHEDKKEGWIADKARCDRAQMALDYVTRRKLEIYNLFPGCTVRVQTETRSNPGALYGRDDWWGTADITIIAVAVSGECVLLEVADYKDGRMWVAEKNNTQLIGAIGGRIGPFIKNGVVNIGSCRATIIQPKTSKPIRYQDLTTAEMMSQLNDMYIAAGRTDEDQPAFVPDGKGGKGYCHFCKHKINCTSLSHASVKTLAAVSAPTSEAAAMFEKVADVIGDTSILNNIALVEIADAEPAFMSIFVKVKNEMIKRLNDGQPMPGYMMKPGKMTKVWNKPPDEMVKILRSRRLKRDQMYPLKFISVAKLLSSELLTDIQKEKLLEEHVTLKPGNPTLTKIAHVEIKTPEQLFSDDTVTFI